jgi:hypothetical protein
MTQITKGPRLDIFEDDEGAYHYVAFESGRPNARADAQTLCGRSPHGMRTAAWFRVGDPRGGVHFARACRACGEALVV